MKIIEQTYDEKVKMYMKCKKIELIDMLIECNKSRRGLTLSMGKLK